MAVKAVEMVRKIRDNHYEQSKDLTHEEQVRLVRKGAEELRKSLGGERREEGQGRKVELLDCGTEQDTCGSIS